MQAALSFFWVHSKFVTSGQIVGLERRRQSFAVTTKYVHRRSNPRINFEYTPFFSINRLDCTSR